MIVTIPPVFVWQRYASVSAGQTIEEILEEKEQQRLASGGMFFWAVGTSISPQIDLLLRETDGRPLVLFSPTLTAGPNSADPRPGRIATWVGGEIRGRAGYRFPDGLTATTADDGQPRYALVCRSDEELRLVDYGPTISRDRVVHIDTGRRLADSRVTAAVRIADDGPLGGAKYPVTFTAQLVEPWFVTLTKRG